MLVGFGLVWLTRVYSYELRLWIMEGGFVFVLKKRIVFCFLVC